VVNYYIIYLAGSELLQFLIYLLGIWNAVLDVLVPDLDPIVFMCLYLSLFVSICFFQVFLYHEYASPGPWFKPFWFKPCFTSGDIYIYIISYHIRIISPFYHPTSYNVWRPYSPASSMSHVTSSSCAKCRDRSGGSGTVLRSRPATRVGGPNGYDK
jgi:hypothetical protein